LIANMTGSLLGHRRARQPQASDHEHVVALVREAVEDLALEPPIDLRIVASYFGIARVSVLPLPWAGCLIAGENGVEIKLNAADRAARQRFTGFHEVTHTFMPGFRLVLQFRCNPARASKRRDALESLCDVGASEFLLPHRFFREDVASGEFGLDLVEELASSYEASLEATANRLVDYWPERTAFLSLEVRNKPRDPVGSPPKLRVNSAHAAPGFPYAPRHKSIDIGSVACLSEGGAGEVEEIVDDAELLGRQLGRVHVHARPYPYTDQEGTMKQRVLALIRRTTST
jgi:hypothetical protein